MERTVRRATKALYTAGAAWLFALSVALPTPGIAQAAPGDRANLAPVAPLRLWIFPSASQPG